MDSRLLTAINDVLVDTAIDVANAGSAAGEAGPALRKWIRDKAATKNASTGTPIPLLRGIAAERATLAAVGGGAKSAGGRGMVGGGRVLDQAELKIQLANYGITAVTLVAQIGMRYAVLVRLDRTATREDEAAPDNGERPSR